ncbi:TetR family transcriptional regulator [Asanoa ishikariensis]|uniref:Transcriptional regulator, TetR family n=1 Tax=Asanoa ishikariensis TaxID=137265 RepID=A0A1H3SYW0_9ACTN|nr:TetR/AcrR family transcriptional regulator [Asanoa ishikariensis]GIF63239.1 TetR family transcriptional regulator [Asanoa ishikariensis]SDZ43114.1 transcriptional regulator, TetR family [Asanoa ishikariensis]
MSIQARRERERADRERLIVSVARELAETEGWEAVTTRRLAERVEYSQPVLYSHFKGKDAIVAAVAVEGFADLAAKMRAARGSTRSPQKALANVAAAYVAFAEQHPALYDAMFNQLVSLPFATPEAPAALHAGFDELRQVVRPIAGDDNVDLLAEVLWSGLHGLVSLTRGGRLPRQDHERRLALLLSRVSR